MGDGVSAGGTAAIGVLVGLVSTCVQSIGLALQRKSHIIEDQKDEDQTRIPAYKRRRWQIGMGMFLLSNIVGSTIQITVLPLPVLSTLQASGLVFNSICATVLLKEPFTRYSLIGTILVAGGAAIIATFGSMTEPSHNLNQLLELLGQGNFIGWLIATGAVAAIVQFAAWYNKKRWHKHTPRSRLLRGLGYGFISGVLSAHCLLIAKSAVELLVRTIVDRHNQFDRWQSWLILLGLVFFALTQLWYLHRGLRLCSTSVVYPFVFCIYNVIAILDGLIYFRQTSRLSPLHAGLIALGTIILLAGVLALSWRLEKEEEQVVTHRRMTHGRLPTPITAFNPGIGVLNAAIPPEEEGEEAIQEVEEEEEETSPFLANAEIEQHFDPERGFSKPRIASAESNDPANERSSRGESSLKAVDERTPLIRTPTTPFPKVKKRSPAPLSPAPRSPASSKRKSSGRPAPVRRSNTIAQEAGDVWDELNDDGHDGHNRRSSIR